MQMDLLVSRVSMYFIVSFGRLFGVRKDSAK